MDSVRSLARNPVGSSHPHEPKREVPILRKGFLIGLSLLVYGSTGVERLLETGWDDALMFDVLNFDGCDYALISGVGDSLEDLSLAVGSPAWTSCGCRKDTRNAGPITLNSGTIMVP